MIANFYVHIIESPSPEELLDGLTEGRALCSFLDIARIPYSYNLAVNHDQFCIALTDRIEEAASRFNLPPILHLSTHGGEQGIQLTSQRPTGELITWNELRKHIHPIYEFFGALGICMSCCRGANGSKMAQVIDAQHVPFSWIIGTETEVDLRDTALAFAVFYRRFACGEKNIEKLLNAMKFASGVYDFNLWSGNLTQQSYSQALGKQFRTSYENFMK